MSVQEVIDPTSEAPVQLAIDTLDLGSNPSQDGRKPKRKKKSPNSKSSLTGTPEVPSTLSLSDSNQRSTKLDHSTKRKRIHETPGSSERRSHERDSGELDKSNSADPFFVDLSPTAIPSIPVSQESFLTTNAENTKVEKLLLPSHVTVFGNTLVEIISQPLSDSDGDEFIKYLDYEDTRNVPRYYDQPPDQTAALDRTVCKNCGAEGEHKTSACPVQICLTCGVRNEHSTRSCPISKVCFTCGMKGHINANCPNRHSGRTHTGMRDDDCVSCSSVYHKTNECPTWWRLYEYLASEDQTRTLARRLSKKGIKLGQGGEGYVGDDEWCYNCGDSGHWGDDCHDPSSTRSLGEHSAFGNNNMITGPFYDPNKEPKSPSSRSRIRDWEQTDQMFNWGKGAPDHVGRQARIKSMAALEKKSRQDDDDPDDWFGNNLSKSIRAPRHPPREPKKISFGKSFDDERKYAPQATRPPSLLTRLGGYHHSNSRSHDANRHDEGRRSRKSRNKNDNRHEREESYGSSNFVDKHRQDIPTGPRYRGGYTR